MHRPTSIAILLACTSLISCGKQDNGTGTYAEDGKEIAKKGSFQGQETYGQVGTVEDQADNAGGAASPANAVE
jgi:hypothetical protein